MRISCVFCLLVAAYILCSGCVYSRSQQLKALKAEAESKTAPSQNIATGDKLHVTVFGEDKLSGDYQVNTSGQIVVPLAGAVQAADLTEQALEVALRDKLKREYLRDPKVSVDTVSVQPFYVLGEVKKPGEYPYKNGLNIWRALALAGGQTYRASTSTVMVQRRGEAQWHEYNLSADHFVDPGDLIKVPERWF